MVYLNGKEGKPGTQCRFIFQWKQTNLQFVAYLNGRLFMREAGLCRRSQTQWERRDNHRHILTGNSMFWILGLSQHGIKFEDAKFNGKFQQGKKSIFQWEITGLWYLAYLSRKKCRRSWTQQERRDNWGLISMGNSVFTVFGLSQWEKLR